MSGEVFVPAKPDVTIPYRINVKWLRYIEERYSGHEKPVEAFMEDVLSGRIRDENGLKLSPSQVEGRGRSATMRELWLRSAVTMTPNSPNTITDGA